MAARKAPYWDHPAASIESWQAEACGEDEAISTGIIAALFDGLMESLRVMLETFEQQRPLPPFYHEVEGSSAALLFWGSDLGVSQGELDMTLQHSGRLRDMVLVVLISIGEFMSQALIKIIPTAQKREELLRTSNIIALLESARTALEEPEEEGDYTQFGTDGLCSTLRTKIESLSLLTSSLESPAEDGLNDEEEAKGLTGLHDRPAHEYFMELIGTRFPLADRRLVEALGRSNWNRYNHVQRLREYAQHDPELTGAETENKAKSRFHDSGLGSSAPARSVFMDNPIRSLGQSQLDYAPTVVSSRAQASHRRLPPLPEEARSGEPFKCEVCDRTVKIRRTKEWKKHVFEDLCAYTCIYSDCASASVFFEDNESMKIHLESQHGIAWESPSQTCPLCLEQTPRGRDLISLHFSRHLEEIAIGVLPRDTESDDDSEASEDGSEGSQDGPAMSFFTGINGRNAPLSDEELDELLPGEDHGYRILPPPPGYEPLRSPSKKVEATLSRSTRLLRCCEKGDFEAAKNAYEVSPDELNAPDCDGVTPLQTAARNGHGNIVEFLLDQGCSTNVQDWRNHDTPLITAVQNGHIEVVETLLRKARADPAHENMYSKVALAAARNGHDQILSSLLATGLPFDHPDPAIFDETPMLVAIRNGHLNVIHLLLAQNEFDPTRRNREGLLYWEFAENFGGPNWHEAYSLLKKAYQDKLRTNAHRINSISGPPQYPNQHLSPPPHLHEMAARILGPLITAPVMQTILQYSDDSMEENVLIGLKHVLEAAPDARDNFQILMRALNRPEGEKSVLMHVQRLRNAEGNTIEGLGQLAAAKTPTLAISQSIPGQAQAVSSPASNQPPAAQQRTMVMPDRIRWVYLDPSGKVQGPWTGLEMDDWYKAGFFSPELLVKKQEDPEYEPLAELIRRIGNSREPFLLPQIGIPHSPLSTQSGDAWANSGITTGVAHPRATSATHVEHIEMDSKTSAIDGSNESQVQLVILNQIRQTHRPLPGQWQATLNAEQRAGMLWNLYQSIRLAKPDMPDNQVLYAALSNENERFVTLSSREEYIKSIRELLQRLQDVWNQNIQVLQAEIQPGNNPANPQAGMASQAPHMQRSRANQSQNVFQQPFAPQLLHEMQASPLPMAQNPSSIGMENPGIQSQWRTQEEQQAIERETKRRQQASQGGKGAPPNISQVPQPAEDI